jgi:hypothetical protein
LGVILDDLPIQEFKATFSNFIMGVSLEVENYGIS